MTTDVPRDVPGDVALIPLSGEGHTVAEWTNAFHLCLVVLDPFTYESGWIIDTAARVLGVFSEADCRTAFLVAGNADEARTFLGPWAPEFLTFIDPDRTAISAMGLTSLPAFVMVNGNHQVEAVAEGWQPEEWRAVAERLATVLSWQRPTIPDADDPVPFEGTPAAG